MRCSFSEAHLDAYVDGALPTATRVRLDAHLATCARCRSLADDVRAVDALLASARTLEPLPNFTFAVMAEARALPTPQRHHVSPFAILGAYVTFAWVTIAAFLIWGGSAARAMVATLGESVTQAGAFVATLASVTGHLFGHQTFEVTAAMGALLAGDMVVAGAIVALYAYLRARRCAIPGAC